MRIGKEHPFGSQPVHVWRPGLRIALQHSSPVIQIIDGDEENVGPLRGRSWFFVLGSLLRLRRVGVRYRRRKQQNGQGEDSGSFHWCVTS